MKNLFIFFICLIPLFLLSTIINIPDDYTMIQEGIDAAEVSDTVLVQPGTYVENIDYNGKNITIASLFITTQDTTYISQTIIDGNQNGSVVTFENEEDSTAVLTGFTIMNGLWSVGGGVICFNNSNPSLVYLTILNNSVAEPAAYRNGYGGGIGCYESSPSLENVTITGNSADWGVGGGIYCSNSNPSLVNVTITDNSAGIYGGGIYCYDNSNPSLVNVKITDNSANSGGGIYCDDSCPSLENVTISKNYAAYNGGGIKGSPSFDPINRCNIYLNYAGSSGCDLYGSIDVVVDTFTVSEPDEYFAFPIENFTFDILNAKIEQVAQDLFVSPTGSNENSGLTADDPLRNIYYAHAKILPDSTNNHTIHLSNGIYSASTNGEMFPVNCRSYISLSGEAQASTILDAEEESRILHCQGVNNLSIMNMTIQDGIAYSYSGGGGIFCDDSNLSLMYVTISDNHGFEGGGIFCNSNSNLSLMNVTISGNSACFGCGICSYSSNLSIINVTISNNTAEYAEYGGGIWCADSNPNLVNVTITGNSADYCGGIYCGWNSNPILVNCMLWNDSPQEVYFKSSGDSNTITISYSDIQGGEAGIETNDNGTVFWLEGNIDEDPLFVETGDDPYSLLEGSPCIDAGSPDTSGLNLPPWDIIDNHRIWDGDGDGEAIVDMGAYEYGAPPYVEIDEDIIVQIPEVHLYQNYPNPFNPSTTINFSNEQNEHVEMNVYNIKGQLVKTLVNDIKPAGYHSIIWDGTDRSNHSVPSGVYLYRLKTNSDSNIRKMILLR